MDRFDTELTPPWTKWAAFVLIPPYMHTSYWVKYTRTESISDRFLSVVYSTS